MTRIGNIIAIGWIKKTAPWPAYIKRKYRGTDRRFRVSFSPMQKSSRYASSKVGHNASGWPNKMHRVKINANSLGEGEI